MAEQISVLHLEDDPDVLDLVNVEYRDQPDVDAQLVSEPEAALSTLTADSFDVLVSDSVTLPSGEPFVLAARRRAPSIPIVLYTGSDWRDIETVATEAGVDGHVQKGDAAAFDRVLERIRSLTGDDPAASEVEFRSQSARGSSGAPSSVDADTTGAPSSVDAGASEQQSLSGGDWSRIGVHDWEASDELGLTVVRAVERAVGSAVVERSVLYDAVDPDALEALLEPAKPGPSGLRVQVRFPYAGCEIAVRDDGVVAARSLDDD
jgi:DNA-binding response OmpR family regulator